MRHLAAIAVLALVAGCAPSNDADPTPTQTPELVSDVLTSEAQQALTPEEVLEDLKEGNRRFTEGRLTPRDYMAQAAATASGQYPKAVVLGCVMDGNAPRVVDGIPDTRDFLVRTEDLQFKSTWQHVSAMRGTGSNAFSAQDVFVPEGFVVAPGDPPLIERPYFRVPMLLHIISADAAVILGTIENVLATIVPALSEQKAAVNGEWRRDQVATQELIVHCTYMFRSAQAVLREVTELASQRIETGEEIRDRERAELYAIVTQIFEIGRQLASALFAGGTRDAFVQGHPLEQALKDLHAIAYARSATRFVVHSAGRVLLGGEHDPGL